MSKNIKTGKYMACNKCSLPIHRGGEALQKQTWFGFAKSLTYFHAHCLKEAQRGTRRKRLVIL